MTLYALGPCMLPLVVGYDSMNGEDYSIVLDLSEQLG